MVDYFQSPTPDEWQKDPQIAEWLRGLLLVLDQLLRPEGAIATSEATTVVVLTQQQKLDLMTITQSVNLDTMEADTASNKTKIDLIASTSPTYTISNDGTDRAFNANAAVSGTGIDVDAVTGTNVALLADHDALVAVVQELADVVATLIRDLANKNVLDA